MAGRGLAGDQAVEDPAADAGSRPWRGLAGDQAVEDPNPANDPDKGLLRTPRGRHFSARVVRREKLALAACGGWHNLRQATPAGPPAAGTPPADGAGLIAGH